MNVALPITLLLMVSHAASTVYASPTSSSSAHENYLRAEIPIITGLAEHRSGHNASAIAAGRVVQSAPSGLSTLHLAYENHHRIYFRIDYVGLEKTSASVGMDLKAGDAIGLVGDSYGLNIWQSNVDGDLLRALSENEFRNRSRNFISPHAEDLLLLVHHDSYSVAFVRRGEILRKYEIAFGQAKGAKRIRGDNRTPKGQYFVVQKHSGKFGGTYGAYYGGHWIKVNYPNAFDAERGLKAGIIDLDQAQKIRETWAQRKLTPQKTRLGSGIGFHGWAYPWTRERDGRHLSWGCMVMHTKEIAAEYRRVPLGTMVVIY